MKAIATSYDAETKSYEFRRVELERPTLRPDDVLVEVRAFATNPADFKVAAGRGGRAEPLIVGWDFAGIVVDRGSRATQFELGDEVYGAGDISRPGSYAELVAVDSRVIAKKPRRLSFAEAAALPLTSLTAWEALIGRPGVELGAGSTVLLIGGAGGVGSVAIQLLKAKTSARVIATASRSESIDWVKRLGADHTIDHHQNLSAQLETLGIRAVDAVLSTTNTDRYLPAINAILRPFGSLSLIDDPPVLDVTPLKRKAISVHWELMFTKTLYGFELESQGRILAQVAELVDAGKVQSTLRTRLVGATPEHLAAAQQTTLKAQTVGKIVIETA